MVSGALEFPVAPVSQVELVSVELVSQVELEFPVVVSQVELVVPVAGFSKLSQVSVEYFFRHRPGFPVEVGFRLSWFLRLSRFFSGWARFQVELVLRIESVCRLSRFFRLAGFSG